MTIYETLQKYFGYDSFRAGQEELIRDILAGKDVLGIMPTGAGKSMCFQIPALMLDGLTLVVSPLISLMKDQVNTLTHSGITAAYINSSLTEGQISKALSNAKGGAYKLIYVAPERLTTYDFTAFAKSVNISMLTVDEAHCISEWGQDFRPSYSKIPEFIAGLDRRPVVSAFTATATPIVQSDITARLELNDPTVLVSGFDRKNLSFDVKKPQNRFAALTEFLRDKNVRTGIIYCSTRATVEEVCLNLRKKGFNASRYHAGLSDAERRDNQDDFLYDRVQIMVATNAFGMGIDKSNVSFVVHYTMPMNLEAYYQEAGRAGRDGSPADCLLLYSGQDVHTNLWMIDNPRDVEYQDPRTETMLKERDRKRLKEMTFYCTTRDCLRGYILKYFGEKPPNYCGNCSNCNTHFETEDVTLDAQKIISCVARMKERFGVVMLIDVLRGSRNEKVLRNGLDRLSTHGISKKSESQLRDIINHLLLTGGLVKTDDEYPIIKLGPQAAGILRGSKRVEMKLAKEAPPKEKAPSRRRPSVIYQNDSPVGQGAEMQRKGRQIADNYTHDTAPEKKPAAKTIDTGLFERLKELRLTIATEQKVPAFVILHDSSLTDMCIKLPKTIDELLRVSGIGQVKADRFGQRFLDAIASAGSE
ncbi:MAG: DNA helicase RecQ [Defluviitaleaceae bacterium]|nr:DNA helicase RecQ [Defluviitaleaceae bacterium]